MGWGNCLLCWQRATEESGFLVLRSSLCFLLSSPSMAVRSASGGKEEGGGIWMQQLTPPTFCWYQLPSLGILCPWVSNRPGGERVTYVACRICAWGKICLCPLRVPYFQGLPSRPVVCPQAQDSAPLKGLVWKVLGQVNQENY